MGGQAGERAGEKVAIANETMLYEPIKAYLCRRGFAVRSEVAGRDLVAVRGDEVVVVELKRTFNLSLLLQGVERQGAADYVYLAVEAPARPTRRWSQVRGLCERLGLGLLTVSFPAKRPARVDVAVEARRPDDLPRKKAERKRLLDEFNGRSGDYNVGGSTRRPIVTAYREDALHLASTLKAEGAPQTVKALREATGCDRAGRILQDNYYGWFERVRRGVYRLTPAGEEALVQYAYVIEAWSQGR